MLMRRTFTAPIERGPVSNCVAVSFSCGSRIGNIVAEDSNPCMGCSKSDVRLLTALMPCVINQAPKLEGDLMKAVRFRFAAMVLAAFVLCGQLARAQVLNQVPEQAL